jgi:hypothetical protein
VGGKRDSRGATSSGPVSINILTDERLLALHQTLAEHFGRDPKAFDAGAVSAAVAYQFDAGSLAGHDPRAQAALLVLGLRDARPFGALDAPMAFLCALVLLDQNGYGLDRVAYDEIGRAFQGLGERQPLPRKGAVEGEDEASALFHWLVDATRAMPKPEFPLGFAHLRRMLEAKGMQIAPGQVGLEVKRPETTTGKGFLGLGTRTVEKLKLIYKLADPGDGLVSISTQRALQEACGLTAEDLVPGPEARLDSFLRQHHNLWPRLLKAWPEA